MTETEFKKLLWDSANKLRGAMSAAEYKFPVLGLVFPAPLVAVAVMPWGPSVRAVVGV